MVSAGVLAVACMVPNEKTAPKMVALLPVEREVEEDTGVQVRRFARPPNSRARPTIRPLALTTEHSPLSPSRPWLPFVLHALVGSCARARTVMRSCGRQAQPSQLLYSRRSEKLLSNQSRKKPRSAVCTGCLHEG